MEICFESDSVVILLAYSKIYFIYMVYDDDDDDDDIGTKSCLDNFILAKQILMKYTLAHYGADERAGRGYISLHIFIIFILSSIIAVFSSVKCLPIFFLICRFYDVIFILKSSRVCICVTVCQQFHNEVSFRFGCLFCAEWPADGDVLCP